MRFKLMLCLALVAQFSVAYRSLDKLVFRGFHPELIIDVGANIGRWTEAIRVTYRNSSCLMIEGNAELIPSLEKVNAPYEIAVLGAKAGQTIIFYRSKADKGKTGSSIFKEDTGFYDVNVGGKNRDVKVIEERVITKTLDDIVRARGMLGKVTLLKLDIQGAEIEALKGASELLKTTDFILSEVSIVQYNKGAPSFAKTVYYMNKIGFVLYDVNDMIKFNYGNSGSGKFLVQMDILWVKKTSYYYSKEATAFDPILEESYADV